MQPVDPLDEWRTSPFEPEVRDGNLYGRGAVDDKGQVWMHLKAVEVVLAVRGELPLNLKLIVEGEEESGSVHFEEIVESEQERLRADILVVSDTSIVAAGMPSLCTGLRGLAGVEVHVQGPSLDLHSGRFGGAVANPVAALAEILASLHDPVTRRVTVPGFYDDVREPSAEERELFAQRALRRRRVPRRGGRRAGHGRRGGLDRPRAPLGASHPRVQRHLGRLLRPRPEDDHPGQRRRQDHLPAGARTRIPQRIADLVRDAVLAAAPAGVTVTAEAKEGGGRWSPRSIIPRCRPPRAPWRASSA